MAIAGYVQRALMRENGISAYSKSKLEQPSLKSLTGMILLMTKPYSPSVVMRTALE